MEIKAFGSIEGESRDLLPHCGVCHCEGDFGAPLCSARNDRGVEQQLCHVRSEISGFRFALLEMTERRCDFSYASRRLFSRAISFS
jgi:hypothetical protein